mmetsp:Transcript_32509/g.71079  ORF Transcript_32509/g.71079 Transcript_32509/m.71079 type:complete len:93 (-) Transcript_32509:245-523(-)
MRLQSEGGESQQCAPSFLIHHRRLGTTFSRASIAYGQGIFLSWRRHGHDSKSFPAIPRKFPLQKMQCSQSRTRGGAKDTQIQLEKRLRSSLS